MEPLRVFTSFSGYDSQALALEMLKNELPGFDYDLVGWSEIDKYAIQLHDAIFPQYKDRNFGDICKIDWEKTPDFDFFTYSSPCQDFSNAGLQRGGEEGSGTRSSLLWECKKAITAKHPKYLMMENVKALVSKKFLPTFRMWLDWLEGEGYRNYYQVLNAKDYGVPQNRERIFVFSIRNDVDQEFFFPSKMELTRCLGDVLEQEVDEKYYLSEKAIEGFLAHNDNHEEKGTGFM